MSKRDSLISLILVAYFVLAPVIYFKLGGINGILPVVIASIALTLYISLKKLRFQ